MSQFSSLKGAVAVNITQVFQLPSDVVLNMENKIGSTCGGRGTMENA